MLGVRNPEAALNNLRAFIHFDTAYSFVLTQRPAWQEVAVTDGRRLILWHGSGLSPLGWWEFGDGAEVGGDVQAVSVPVLGWAIA